MQANSPSFLSYSQALRQSLQTLPLPVILYLICVVTPIRFMAGPLQMTNLRLYLAIMSVVLIYKAIKREMPPLIPSDILFIAYMLTAGVAMSFTTPSQAIENFGSTGLEFLGGYFIARTYIRNRAQFTALIIAACTLVFLSAPLAFFETITGTPPLISALIAVPGLSSVAIVDIDPRLGLERVQALFAHPIHYGLFCSSIAAMVFVGLRFTLGFKTRAVCLIILSACCFIALSSGALLALLIQLFLIAWAFTFDKLPGRWLILSLGVLFCYVAVDLLSNRTPIKVFFTYATYSAHNAYWRGIIFEWGLKNIWGSPIVGIGLNDWLRPHFMRSGSIDNYWLVVAMRNGLPAFALLVSGYLWGLWKVCRKPLGDDVALLALRQGWAICFVGLTFTLCTVHIWTAIYSYVFFLFGAGMWILAPQEAPASKTQNNPEASPLSRRVRHELTRA
jgi:hypothetical protein